MGGVIYIYTGQAIKATIRATPFCFSEIPVEFENSDGKTIEGFATSIGRIFVENGTRVDCNHFSSMHFIEGKEELEENMAKPDPYGDIDFD